IGAEAVTLAANYLFNSLHLHQIYCNVLKNNPISLKLFEKCGFSIIGIKKDWTKTETGFEDVIMLQRINDTKQ
ncbi:MAG: GNAT family N-acetyltransferase, partial [Bacteroidales bacterium]|nr:GNAT family N-acetyltransferase [Bacteroidales bacterium]